jgi:hypothetical protein
MFPRLMKKTGGTWATVTSWNGGTVAAADPLVLEGQQCLVFYLGGIPSTAGGQNQCLGFSDNPTDPTGATVSKRIGPFYQFDPTRLSLSSTNGFFSYLDPYAKGTTGQPYAFFGTGTNANSYNSTSDCPSLGISPYYQGTQYFNPKTWQIISAGPDRNFGAGGALWTPSGGTSDIPTRDNLTNFSRTALQYPQS